VLADPRDVLKESGSLGVLDVDDLLMPRACAERIINIASNSAI